MNNSLSEHCNTFFFTEKCDSATAYITVQRGNTHLLNSICNNYRRYQITIIDTSAQREPKYTIINPGKKILNVYEYTLTYLTREWHSLITASSYIIRLHSCAWERESGHCDLILS